MPKKLTDIPRRLDAFANTLFFCPSCATWRLSVSKTSASSRPPGRRRHASTLVSSTAVNATKQIPEAYRKLHEALGDVKKKASAHVNLSRLQLALQGIESDSPTTRVAVLGINAQTTARGVVRLLLADALNVEERWEKRLVKDDEGLPEGLLIRYGQPPNPSLPQPKTAIPILQIPASVLERNNIEILISSVSQKNVSGVEDPVPITSDAFLSPTISTPTHSNGRYTPISQPVHKALVVCEGLDGLLSVAELLASTKFSSTEDRRMITVVMNLSETTLKPQDEIFVVDMPKAEIGLSAIRKTVAEATVYEHNWRESGMPSLSKWLTLASASRASSPFPSPIRDLVSSLLTAASSNLKILALQSAKNVEARSMSPSTRAGLESTIDAFSHQAHQELQSGLASAWSSRNWRKLAWYKLFWRVDDVSLIITDLVTNAWLPETERSVYELSGRLAQAGISPVGIELGSPEIEVEPSAVANLVKPLTAMASQQELAIAGQGIVEPVLVNRGGIVSVTLSPTSQQYAPLAAAISTTRQTYMTRAIDELTTAAQQLVFRTLSITGLTAGLSGLAYFSVTAGSVYEAGTIVALGTAYALRRMQTDWQRSCRGLEEGLMETGRTVLKQLEERMRILVRQGGKAVEDELELKARRDAEEAVQRAREELEKVS